MTESGSYPGKFCQSINLKRDSIDSGNIQEIGTGELKNGAVVELVQYAKKSNVPASKVELWICLLQPGFSCMPRSTLKSRVNVIYKSYQEIIGKKGLKKHPNLYHFQHAAFLPEKKKPEYQRRRKKRIKIKSKDRKRKSNGDQMTRPVVNEGYQVVNESEDQYGTEVIVKEEPLDIGYEDTTQMSEGQVLNEESTTSTAEMQKSAQLTSTSRCVTASLRTVKRWELELNIRLEYQLSEDGSTVKHIWCAVCKQYSSNRTSSLVTGSSVVKKESVKYHQNSDWHRAALRAEAATRRIANIKLTEIENKQTSLCQPGDGDTGRVTIHPKKLIENKGSYLIIKNVGDLQHQYEVIQAQTDHAQPIKSHPSTIKPMVTENQLAIKLQYPDPTAFCTKEDMAYINEALVEVDVMETDSSTDTELVCAVSSKTVMILQQGQSLQMDRIVYLCNFCTYKSDKKEVFLRHVLEHRFICKHCKYQSFSRADVMKHNVLCHPALSETWKRSKFCYYLPDILLRHEARKRKMSNSHSDDDTPSMKKTRVDPKKTDLNQKIEVEGESETSENDIQTDILQHQGATQPVISNDIHLSPSSKPTTLPLITNVMSGEQAISAATGSTSYKESSVNKTPPAKAPAPHVIIISSLNSMNCSYCSSTFSDQYNLRTHIKSKHPIQAKLDTISVMASDEKKKDIEGDDQYHQNDKPGNINAFIKKFDASELDSYKCAHCNYSELNTVDVKRHLLRCHAGAVIYALDLTAVKMCQYNRYIFFCMNSKCPFETKVSSEFLEHSESCMPCLNSDSMLAKSLEMTKQFVIGIQENLIRQMKSNDLPRYSCVHCSTESSDITKQKRHVLSYHSKKACVFRDLLARVYFCKYCLWETKESEKLETHLMQVHKKPTNRTAATNTLSSDLEESNTTMTTNNDETQDKPTTNSTEKTDTETREEMASSQNDIIASESQSTSLSPLNTTDQIVSKSPEGMESDIPSTSPINTTHKVMSKSSERMESDIPSSLINNTHQVMSKSSERMESDMASISPSSINTIHQVMSKSSERMESDMVFTLLPPINITDQVMSKSPERMESDIASISPSSINTIHQVMSKSSERMESDMASTSPSPINTIDQVMSKSPERMESDIALTSHSQIHTTDQVMSKSPEKMESDIGSTSPSSINITDHVMSKSPEGMKLDIASTSPSPVSTTYQVMSKSPERMVSDIASTSPIITTDQVLSKSQKRMESDIASTSLINTKDQDMSKSPERIESDILSTSPSPINSTDLVMPKSSESMESDPASASANSDSQIQTDSPLPLFISPTDQNQHSSNAKSQQNFVTQDSSLPQTPSDLFQAFDSTNTGDFQVDNVSDCLANRTAQNPVDCSKCMLHISSLTQRVDNLEQKVKSITSTAKPSSYTKLQLQQIPTTQSTHETTDPTTISAETIDNLLERDVKFSSENKVRRKSEYPV